MQRFPWRYVLAWIPMVPIAILNGVLRVQTYGRLMPEIHAHQLSTLTGVVLIGSYIALVLRRWPTASVAEAWRVGLMWVVMTVGFEFGFGHYVMGQPWRACCMTMISAPGGCGCCSSSPSPARQRGFTVDGPDFPWSNVRR
jgi:hypothetical protein